MSANERWQRIMALFESAVACAPQDRAALLDEACGDDDGLRREVAALLAHDAAADTGFLPPAQPPTTITAAILDMTDQRVGLLVAGYRLTAVLATGGMGAVYRARDEELARDVALKVVRPGLASPSALRRFEHEARFLARLQHPHIAQVYRAAMFDDPVSGIAVPFFVMELVEGAQAITDYCANARGDGAALDLPARLALFQQVCDAVHHGHQRGLIHRDLKPSNILVDAAGRVKIIDFGVALSTDADLTLTTLETASGHLIGTLQYMSPEQCGAGAGDLDVRSDVYALGVVLYELACGQPPYDLRGATIFSAARIVCEQPVAPPRLQRGRLPRDVTAIVLKCLEKSPARRYQSAAQLGDDLARRLAGEAVSARPPGVYRRATRWAARHAIAATALVCGLFLALTGIATAIGVRYLAMRPDHLWMAPDGKIVQLETVGGVRIGRELSNPHHSDHVAVPSFVEHNGRRLCLIAALRRADDSVDLAVTAYDADIGLTTNGVVWSDRLKHSDIPVPPIGRTYPPASFTPYELLLGQVVDDTPEPEIISFWAHHYSLRAVRIYDLDGHLLYQIWHDGSVGSRSVRYHAPSGLLVCGGSYTTHDPWDIAPGVPPNSYDLPMVFAIKPRLGFITNRLMDVPETPALIAKRLARYPPEAFADRYAPVWYKFVWPLHRAFRVQVKAVGRGEYHRQQSGRALGDISVDVLDTSDRSYSGFSWVIDRAGASIPGTHSAGDIYRRAMATSGLALPVPEQHRLVDLETLLADPFGDLAYGTAPDQTVSASEAEHVPPN